jgi:hypothetical protein
MKLKRVGVVGGVTEVEEHYYDHILFVVIVSENESTHDVLLHQQIAVEILTEKIDGDATGWGHFQRVLGVQGVVGVLGVLEVLGVLGVLGVNGSGLESFHHHRMHWRNSKNSLLILNVYRCCHCL